MEAVAEKVMSVCGPSFRSPSGKRMMPRVAMPSQIEVSGMRYPLLDFGLGGCALESAGPLAAMGDAIRADLLLQVGTVTIVASDLIVKVLRTEQGRAKALQFVELPGDASHLLDRAVEDWLRGSLPRADALLAKRRTPSVPGAARGSGSNSWWRSLRTAILLLAGCAALGAGAYLVLSRWLVVRSEFAAVASPLRLIRASQDGLVMMPGVGVGSAVGAGQVLLRLEPVLPPQVRADLEPRIHAAAARLDRLRGELEQARAGFETFRARAPVVLRAAVASRQMHERQVAASERMFQRVQHLARSGFAPAAQADQLEIELMAQRRALAAAEVAEDNARQQVDDASHGRFLSDGRSTQRTPQEIRREIQAVETELDNLHSTLGRLVAPTIIAAPCSCVVSQIGATSGSYVVAGDPLLGLTEGHTDAAIEIDALVDSTRMGFLQVGQTVDVYLGGASAAMAGRVMQLNFNPENTGRAGLPDNLRTLKSYGLVTVVLDGRPPGAVAGLPVLIAAPIEPSVLLRSVLGLVRIGGGPTPVVRPVETAGL